MENKNWILYLIIGILIVLLINSYSNNSEQSNTTSSTNTYYSQQAEVKDYILNRNTKKFHKPGCSSVGQMKESNKIYKTATRYDIIEMGYAPCQRCNP